MKRNISLITAVSIVVTNMIGMGILTTPGILSSYLTSSGQIMLVWIFGGLIALLGAVVYGQMAGLMPHSGGEFHYLSRIYHPRLGIAAGWVSVIAGFAGPVALSSMAFAKYFQNLPFANQLFGDTISIGIREKIIAFLLILMLSSFHIFRRTTALNFQLLITILLIVLLLLISFLGFNYNHDVAREGLLSSLSSRIPGKPNFGMALLIAIYSYTGWNASCYFAGEIRNPKRNLPLSLLLGVSLVMMLYLAVNYGLLKVMGVSQLSGQVDFLSALGNVLGGKLGSQLISTTVLVILVASISSMIYTGSRIPLLKKSSHHQRYPELGRKGILKMYGLQSTIAILLILFTGFQQLLLMLTLLLTLFTILTAFGIFLLPWRRLKTSKTHEILVKTSATVLLIVLIWLMANSLGGFNDAVFWILIIVFPAFTGLFYFSRLRISLIKNQLNQLKTRNTKIVNRLNITKI